MSRYICIVRSPSSYAREYTVTTSSAYKEAQELGRCEGGEVVEIVRPRTPWIVQSCARWDPERRTYYRCSL